MTASSLFTVFSSNLPLNNRECLYLQVKKQTNNRHSVLSLISSCATIVTVQGVLVVNRCTAASHSVVTWFLFVSFCSGTPDECLTPLVSHPLSDLQFIDSGLGSQVSECIVFVLQ